MEHSKSRKETILDGVLRMLKRILDLQSSNKLWSGRMTGWLFFYSVITIQHSDERMYFIWINVSK